MVINTYSKRFLLLSDRYTLKVLKVVNKHNLEIETINFGRVFSQPIRRKLETK